MLVPRSSNAHKGRLPGWTNTADLSVSNPVAVAKKPGLTRNPIMKTLFASLLVVMAACFVPLATAQPAREKEAAKLSDGVTEMENNKRPTGRKNARKLGEALHVDPRVFFVVLRQR